MVAQTENGPQISIEERPAWNRKLVITVPASRVRIARQDAARQVSKKVRIPGFRKGKVPPHMLEARFAEDIDRRTQQALIDNAFEEAIQRNSLEPISEPRLSNIDYDPGADFTFEVDFDVRPEISLSRISGFRVKRSEVEVSEDDVERHLEALRKSAALWKPVERRPQTGDRVEVSVTNLDEASDPNEYAFNLGEGRAIPGVETAIMTLEPGGAGEFQVEFPDDFPDESKRGQSQNLRVELKKILEQELPEMDDELARSLGDFDDLESLRDAIETDVRKEKGREVEGEVERHLMEQIVEANPFEVPATMVERFITALLGAPPEGLDPEALRAARDEARPAAVWGIRRMLVLQKIAEDQGFEATEEELDERIEAIAKHAGRSRGEVRSRLSRSGDLREMARRIVDEKTFRFLKEQSEIEDAGG